MKQKIKVAVLVECHPFDIIGFQKMLWSFEDCECYVQAFDLFVQDEKNKDIYDCVLYYNMSLSIPEKGSAVRDYLEKELGEKGQGIILLHHALLSFPRWDLWTQVSGVKVRCEESFQYHQNEMVREYIVNKQHPITSGIEDFVITDETYMIGEPEEEGNEILIETDNGMSISKIAWTRVYKKSRVFCYASGHDDEVYSNADFRKIIHQAIYWTVSD